MKSKIILAGDIGGTKTNLAVFSLKMEKPIAVSSFKSAKFTCLEDMVIEFLAQAKMKPDVAVFAVAGPVFDRRAKITNLPWIIKETRLREKLEISSVSLLNDLEAIGNSVPFLKSDDIFLLKEGKIKAKGVIAVIAPGTGLGETFLTWNGSSYQTHASEGGHTDFAPSNPIEVELLEYLQYRYDHVSYETTCSGQGIQNIYTFLKCNYHFEEPGWLAEQISLSEDPTPYIIEAALGDNRICELCVITLNIFLSILGAEAGNLALKTLATGGVYLGGGITPRILPIMKNGYFISAFCRKGRMSELISCLPVYIILNPMAALLGARIHAKLIFDI